MIVSCNLLDSDPGNDPEHDLDCDPDDLASG